MTSKEYKCKSISLLKDMFKFYDSLSDNLSEYSRSDDVIDSLNSAIFYLGCSVCPSVCLSVNDIRDWVFGGDDNGK